MPESRRGRPSAPAAQLFGSPTPIRRGVVVTVVSLLSLLTPVACHGPLATQQTDRTGSLNPFTAEDLVALIGNAGLAAPNPRDVTQRDCPAIGCAEKVETDTVSIIKFRAVGQAQLYAAQHGARSTESKTYSTTSIAEPIPFSGDNNWLPLCQ